MSDSKGVASPPAQRDGETARPALSDAAILAGGTAQGLSAKSTPIEDDRRWFAANPARSYRVRPIDPGEMPQDHRMVARPPGWRHFVVVRQVKPGHRIRVAFAAEGEPATGERAAERLFRLCVRGLKPGAAGDQRTSAGHPQFAVGILS